MLQTIFHGLHIFHTIKDLTADHKASAADTIAGTGRPAVQHVRKTVEDLFGGRAAVLSDPQPTTNRVAVRSEVRSVRLSQAVFEASLFNGRAFLTQFPRGLHLPVLSDAAIAVPLVCAHLPWSSQSPVTDSSIRLCWPRC